MPRPGQGRSNRRSARALSHSECAGVGDRISDAGGAFRSALRLPLSTTRIRVARERAVQTRRTFVFAHVPGTNCSNRCHLSSRKPVAGRAQSGKFAPRDSFARQAAAGRLILIKFSAIGVHFARLDGKCAPLSRLDVCARFRVTAEHAACIRRAQAASSELFALRPRAHSLQCARRSPNWEASWCGSN